MEAPITISELHQLQHTQAEEAFLNLDPNNLEPLEQVAGPSQHHMFHVCLILLSFVSFYFIYYLTLMLNPMLATYKRLKQREQLTWTLKYVVGNWKPPTSNLAKMTFLTLLLHLQLRRSSARRDSDGRLGLVPLLQRLRSSP
jgi:hypothetical protein